LFSWFRFRYSWLDRVAREANTEYGGWMTRHANNVKTMLVLIALIAAAAWLTPAMPNAQAESAQALVASLKKGGYVLVMRHASSPREAPDARSANPDNVKTERQLDEAGRRGAIAMGKAVRDLHIPIGEVLSSPTYRALETVRLAELPNVQSHPELGDGGQSMQGSSAAQGEWLRERAGRLPKGTNTIIVTHMPNISRAFPAWGTVADGEVVVVGRDGDRGVKPLGRIKIEDWPSLRR
jgi:phosphohistidine phosphatase SixA